MKKILIAFLLISGLLSFNRCSTDFDMYAEYEDVTIVYGIADISDDTTWIKITKAYTGPGNALLIAQNPDSSNYPYKLDVNMVGRKNGSNLDPIGFDTLTIHNKVITEIIIDENGDTTILNPFYSPDQLVYYAVGQLDPDAEYTLNIEKINETLTASTGLVDYFSISKPINRIAFIPNLDGSIEWYSAKNGMRYETSIIFNYTELSPGETDTLSKFVYWGLGVENSSTTDGGEDMKVTFSGSEFYSMVESELEPIPNVKRWVGDVDMIVACGSQVLSTYLDINSGAGSLLEEVPVYSNIEGGTGIFASRHTLVKSIILSSRTEDELVSMTELGFQYGTK